MQLPWYYKKEIDEANLGPDDYYRVVPTGKEGSQRYGFYGVGQDIPTDYGIRNVVGNPAGNLSTRTGQSIKEEIAQMPQVYADQWGPKGFSQYISDWYSQHPGEANFAVPYGQGGKEWAVGQADAMMNRRYQGPNEEYLNRIRGQSDQYLSELERRMRGENPELQQAFRDAAIGQGNQFRSMAASQAYNPAVQRRAEYGAKGAAGAMQGAYTTAQIAAQREAQQAYLDALAQRQAAESSYGLGAGQLEADWMKNRGELTSDYLRTAAQERAREFQANMDLARLHSGIGIGNAMAEAQANQKTLAGVGSMLQGVGNVTGAITSMFPSQKSQEEKKSTPDWHSDDYNPGPGGY